MLSRLIPLILMALLPVSFQLFASTTSLAFDKFGFVGTYYGQTSHDKKMGVLVLGGSGGGVPEKLAKPIAEAGFPTLALAYFKAEGLPAELEQIPLEYFDHAASWLQKQQGVDPDKFIVVGWSKGAELALILASRSKNIQQVIAIAPSSAVWAGILKDWTKVPKSSWTENGQDLPFIPFRPTREVHGLLDLYSQSLENRTDNGAADIAIENIQAPLLLMTGENDEIWPSPQMADEICTKINKKYTGQCEHINYKGADHLLNYRFLNKGTEMNKTFIEQLFKAASHTD